MNAATFKTLCEAMGLSNEGIARAFHVTPRTVRYWLSGETPVPDGVADELADLWTDWTEQLGQILDGMEELAGENGDPEAVHFSRPVGSTGADMPAAATARAIAIILGTQGFDLAIDYTTVH